MAILQGHGDARELLFHAPFRASLLRGDADLAQAFALRRAAFRADRGGPDRFDAVSRHLIIEDPASGVPLGTCRLRPIADGSTLQETYCAEYYDLDPLLGRRGAVIEVGRLCVAPSGAAADILRVVWAALARIVERERAGLLIGCASFAGTDPDRHRAAFDLLGRHHLGPDEIRPQGSARSIRFATDAPVAARQGLAALPPLLRSYLAMGGWVGGHAVIDDAMDTIHVFTALDVAAIPKTRRRALLSLADMMARVDAAAPHA
ncbi:putative hemolysin [Palleronia aestuarii]|uniref:L-ornithine N(alpha)-acyltransferase n=1 Tax=Palleronia aestuarii TaxID=568105 RepID=A0A2W7NB50_9RHOB|nr:GNAT family N-acyltransferase [Palleronia aestuarii]PZX17551.1 putative hemolysin [Palleronia aestuarii]